MCPIAPCDRTANTNTATTPLQIYNYLSGAQKEVPPGSMGFVHVADVAKAHIVAYVQPSPLNKRYLCSAAGVSWAAVAELLRKLFPGFPVPEGGDPAAPSWSLNNSRLTALGMQFISVESMLTEQGNSIIKQFGLKPAN
eukprot:gene3530-3981_t